MKRALHGSDSELAQALPKEVPAFAPLSPFVLAFLALSFGAGDLWKKLSSLPTLVGLGLSAGVIALLGLALRWSSKTIQQARHIEAADADEKSSARPLDGSPLKTWGVALAPPILGLLLLLVGALGFIGSSSLGRRPYGPTAPSTLAKFARTIGLSSIPSQIALIMFAAGAYAFPWGLRWAWKTLQKATVGESV